MHSYIHLFNKYLWNTNICQAPELKSPGSQCFQAPWEGQKKDVSEKQRPLLKLQGDGYEKDEG